MNKSNKGTELVFGDAARSLLFSGIEILARAVGATLGPRGRNVILGRFAGIPDVTKDGVTVAQSIELSDPVMEQGVKLVRQAAQKTAEAAGDGTTTSTIVTADMIEAGLAVMNESGTNMVELHRGMNDARDIAIRKIKTITTKITEVDSRLIEAVATISVNNDPVLGKAVAEAYAQVGDRGMVDVKITRADSVHVDYKLGYSFDKGWLVKPADNLQDQYENYIVDRPYILVTNYEFKQVRPNLLHILELANTLSHPLVVICKDLKAPALDVVDVNTRSGAVNTVFIKAPGVAELRDELLSDMAAFTNATFVNENAGDHLTRVTEKHLGRCGQVKIKRRDTILYAGDDDETAPNAARMSQLQEQIDQRLEALSNFDVAQEGTYERDNLLKRRARLSGGIAVIYAGAPTEGQAIERKYRIEDAIYAVKAALKGGVVLGGGVAYLKAAAEIERYLSMRTQKDGEQVSDSAYWEGVAIVKEALQQPFFKIMDNADVSITGNNWVKYGENDEANLGIDAYRREECDLLEAGILDPADVVLTVIDSSVSVAVTVLGTEVIIIPEEGMLESNRPFPEYTGFNRHL